MLGTLMCRLFSPPVGPPSMALFLGVQLSPTVDQWWMVQSISFAFALYESSSYGAKLNMITAHHWSPMCVFFSCLFFIGLSSYCWWMQDTH